MTDPGKYTYSEIISQPQAWAQALEMTGAQRTAIGHLWKNHPQARVMFTGCGSTYYLSLAAASLFQELTGLGARAVPAGELILSPNSFYEADKSVLLVVFSRSGTTSETVAVAQQFKDKGRGLVAVITNYAGTPLAEMGDLTITIPTGQEQSVAQTRSFASMYVAATAFAVLSAGREDLWMQMAQLPALGQQLLQKNEGLVRLLGENLELDRFYFLGSGPRYGLACETNLKMKEMTLTHSEPFHFFEFRHGPMSMVTNTTAIIGLQSLIHAKQEQAVLDQMRALGARVLSLSEKEADVSFESGLPEEILNVLYLPALQWMAYCRALAKGLDPDNPRNLNAVVYLNAGEL